MNCDHIIGLLYFAGDSDLINLKQLACHIQERKEYNRICIEYGLESMVEPEWTLQDYVDGRRSTDLRRFKYCPECGKEIDWETI